MLNARLSSSFLILFAVGVCAAQSPSTTDYSFTVSGAQTWTDTGVDLAAGDKVAATAEVKNPGSDETCNPWGMARTGAGKEFPMPTAPIGVLISKTDQDGEIVVIGAKGDIQSTDAGHLFLGINQTSPSTCAYSVKITIAHGQKTGAGAPTGVREELSSAAQVFLKGQFGGAPASNNTSSNSISENANASASTSSTTSSLNLPTVILDSDLRQHLDSLPRRVYDHSGNLGDMVNFVIVGSQEKVQAALDAAEWHVADVDSKEAGLKAIMNTYEKKDYLQMPMSHLYLWDRMQDFGYEQAQAFSVVATRHHFRMWKSPFTWNNEIVWVGAATHDTGFEKDIRTGHLTHKIDPNVDDERTNLAQGLEKSGKTKSMTYYLPPNPVTEAKNASGGSYHSDGKLLVVFIK